MLGAEAEFGEKLSDQKSGISLSAVGAERTLSLLGQEAKYIYRCGGHAMYNLPEVTDSVDELQQLVLREKDAQ